MRIGQKLILGFVGIALLVGVVGYITINASQKALQKSIGESSVRLAAVILDNIDRNICNRIEEFQAYSKDLKVQKAIIESNEEFEKLDNIQNYIDEKDREWTSVPKEEITPFMQELINSELSKELRERIEFYKNGYGQKVFGEVFVTNKYGANVAQTGKTTDYYQADEKWWQKAKEDGSYVADVKYDESANVYSTDIGIRIDDENGNFIGTTKAVLNIEETVDFIKKIGRTAEYETAEFKLVNREGKILFDPTGEYEFFEDISGVEFFKEITGDTGYSIKEAEKEDAWEKELFSYAHSKGYRDFKGLGWILIIEYETEEIFAPVTKLRNNILITSLSITILAVILGFFISTSISKPITKLRDAATTIGEGNLDTRIEVESNDEIGELAASFNDMAKKLKQSHAHLEERVQERTSELSDEVVEHSGAQEKLQQHVKQLNCFYGLSKLIEQPKISLEQIFQKTAYLISNAYQYPDVTRVRITFDGIQYKTDNFDKSELSQHADIKVRGDKAGAIEVYYLGERAEGGESPFLKEECDLLDTVAKHLGRIAERSQAREKLELLRNLIDRSNDCIFIIEPEWGRFLDVNDRACNNLGYTRKELLDMTIKDIEELISDDSSWQECSEELKLKGDIIKQGRHKRKDGTTFFVETGLKYVSQKEGDYILAIARDITERRRAEERQAKLLKEVESANQELKDFAYIVSHDLKAPLRGIKTLANWMSTDYADKLDEDGRGQINLLLTRVDRMHNLIDGVLAYSRVGRVKEKQVQVNLNELVPGIIDMVAPPENITITVENELPVVKCEETRITQVFQNLLSNAVKYMDKPKGQIKIDCVEENGFWKFSVADNGPGIEEEYFEKIFKIFQTLSPRDEFESTGVGLTVVKKIIEMYGGEIRVESKPGEGSTFFFTLPKQEAGIREDAKRKADIVSRR